MLKKPGTVPGFLLRMEMKKKLNKKRSSARVIKHLRGDMKMFKKEASEDRELIRSLKPKKKQGASKKKQAKPKRAAKVRKVMKEFKAGMLHSGSKKGPLVSNPKQAIAIGLSEAGLSRKKKRAQK